MGTKNKFKNAWFTIIILSLTLLITSCSSSISGETQCTLDSDCIAASCCHSTSSVNKDNAPNCQGILCTASCEPNTMDCGQAKARCVEEICAVVPVE